jgi:hypothetical protein
MTEVVATEVAVGDKVRVHFHPPLPMQSFCEGIVSRVDMTSPEGRFFVMGVTHEVILDREHHIRPGFQDYVRYECQNDFPGRIEVLSTAVQDAGSEHAPVSAATEPPEEAANDISEPPPLEREVHSECNVELRREAEANSEPAPVDVELQPVQKQRGLMAALFGRKK